ncbi:MAG: rod shape-determining protein MreD [Ruminiclostridium sp.]|nr:rod shape-determining protein MreD [Ruminiclostridium sp.]
MKRRILVLSLLIYVTCLMQSTILDYIEIMGIRPNLLLVVAISIALARKDMESAFMGLACGLGMDILVGRTLGWYAMCLFLVCFSIGLINPKLYKENPLIPIFFVFFSSMTVETLYYFINFFLRGYQDFAFMVTRIIIPESIYNSATSLFLYPIILIVYRKLDKYDYVHTRL